jgi:predicted acetyltransferase
VTEQNSSNEYLTLSIDSGSAARLAETGLRFDVVDTSTVDTFGPWYEAANRGFYGPRSSVETIAARLGTGQSRRNSAVWDATSAEPATPVATAAGWPSELTVPGHTSVPAWAISSVTVAPTHRRRGIARALLEAELRTAHRLGIPIAMLTVTESTIYSRWGFAPAAMAANWTIDTDRARWIGPTASGRVHLIEVEAMQSIGPELVERVRLATPGQVEFHGILWDRLIGAAPDSDDDAKNLRFARYDDAEGTAQGFAVYRVRDHDDAPDAAVLELRYLVAVTDDAYAGLWRFLLEFDLVGSIRATMRSTEEPLSWQIADYRAAVKANERDHLWTRILDVSAALTGRRYHSPGHFVLDVTDPLGFAAGRWLLTVSSDGTAVVSELEGDIPDDADAVALGVGELSAIQLGGVSAVTLARAGRIEELTPGAAAVIDRSFRSVTTPWLSIWF